MKIKKKFSDNLSRFRDEIYSFTKETSGLAPKNYKKFKKKELSRKEKRRLEKKLKKIKHIEYCNKKKPTEEETQIEKEASKLSKVEKNKVKKENKAKKEIDNRLERLKEDDKRDDVEIKKLEKLLKIKKDKKNYKKSFYDDGLDTLLDFCDNEKRQDLLKNEYENAWLGQEEDSNDEDQVDYERKEKIRKKLEKINNNENNEESEDEFDEEEDEESDYDDNDSLVSQKEEPMRKKVKFSAETDEDVNEEEEEDDEVNSEDSKNTEDNDKDELKEDIYGRLVDKDGNVVKKPESYIENRPLNPEITLKLNRTLNGLFNRLSTSNMNSIMQDIIKIFYSNEYSRFELIECINRILKNSLIREGVLAPIRFICEYSALVSLLSSHVGTDLGANLLQKFVVLLDETFDKKDAQDIENKLLDNLILFLCYLYNFKLFSHELIFDILDEKLIPNLQKITEKVVELIIIILKSTGFGLRRDSPNQLKDIIVKIKYEINSGLLDTNGENSRLKFMLESLNAIKNNDIRYLAQDENSDLSEKVYKQIKPFYNTNANDVQLNVRYKDLIMNANNGVGKWWIVGSRLLMETVSENKGSTKSNTSTSNSGFSDKILKLAKKHRMNTDTRRNIFCIIVSAEDCQDAFTKLMKLGLKKNQEREIVYIIVHCVLSAKKHNPYYSFLMQKFCEFDRRFRMTLQFHTWDKFKEFSSMNDSQIQNSIEFYSHLVNNLSINLAFLKNLSFGEMDKPTLKFLKGFLLKIIENNSDSIIMQLFTPIKSNSKLRHLRDSLKLFIEHFILRDKSKTSVEMSDTLKIKCELALNCLNSFD